MASISTHSEPQEASPVTNHQLMGVQIVSTGSYVPDKVVRNIDLAALGCDEDWIVQRTGIVERRHCSESQATSDMAVLAAEQCLERAGVSGDEIDLLLVATMTPDHFTPATACIVQHRLGSKAVAWDINAACSGFIYSFITAAQFLKTGSCRKVLVVGADAMSRVSDPRDIKTYPLFGDAAGAVLLQSVPSTEDEPGPGILSYKLATDGDIGHHITVPGCCSRMPVSQRVIDNRLQYLQMDGKPVFKWAVRTVPYAVQKVLDLAGLETSDIDSLLLHQANLRIIDAALEDIDVPSEKVFVNLEKYGNTSAASIPLLLDEAIQAGVTSLENQKILLCGFGAGLTWGSAIYSC